MDNISKTVDEALKHQGLTRMALADKLGWPRGNLTRFLKSGDKGKLENWQKVLEALQLELTVQPSSGKPIAPSSKEASTVKRD